jgi:hypothetical protein
MIMADHVELIYWPVTTTNPNSCGTNGTTITGEDNGPSTIVAMGTTFTSPTLYLSFNSISAYDWGCRTQIGSGVAGTIIPIQPDQLSSARGYHLGRSPYPFNLADLNGFVTSAAYFQMQGYDWSFPRETIFDDIYNPTVWLPDIVTELRPEWTTCDLSPFGVNDPPVALTTVKYVDPTTTKDPIKTPGYELDGSARPGGKPTRAPEPSVLPSGNDPLAPAATDQHTSKPSRPGPAPPASTADDVGNIIASALGLSKPPQLQRPSTTTVTIKIGRNGFQAQDQQDTLRPSDVHAQIKSQDGSQTTRTVQVEYVVAYTMVRGNTVILGDGTTISVGGDAIEVDGYTITAAEGGLVLNDATIAYATDAAAASTVDSGTASSVVEASETAESSTAQAATTSSLPLPAEGSGSGLSASIGLIIAALALIHIL